MKKYKLFLFSVLLSFSALAQNRIFIKQSSPYLSTYDSQGVANYEDYIEIAEASFGVESTEDSRGTLRPKSRLLTIKFKPNEGMYSYPLLFKQKHLGTLLHDGLIVFEKTDGSGGTLVSQRYKFDDFIIVGTEHSAENVHSVIVDFYVSKLEITRESISGQTKYGWDFLTNQAWTAGF